MKRRISLFVLALALAGCTPGPELPTSYVRKDICGVTITCVMLRRGGYTSPKEYEDVTVLSPYGKPLVFRTREGVTVTAIGQWVLYGHTWKELP